LFAAHQRDKGPCGRRLCVRAAGSGRSEQHSTLTPPAAAPCAPQFRGTAVPLPPSHRGSARGGVAAAESPACHRSLLGHRCQCRCCCPRSCCPRPRPWRCETRRALLRVQKKWLHQQLLSGWMTLHHRARELQLESADPPRWPCAGDAGALRVQLQQPLPSGCRRWLPLGAASQSQLHSPQPATGAARMTGARSHGVAIAACELKTKRKQHGLSAAQYMHAERNRGHTTRVGDAQPWPGDRS